MTDNHAYAPTTGTPPPYTQTYNDPPPAYTPYAGAPPQSYTPYAGAPPQAYTTYAGAPPQGTPQVVKVSRSVFHEGARFSDPTRPSIPPPAPGYLPNEVQRMAMQGPVTVVIDNNRR